MLSKFKNIKKWIEDNPKTFYKYTMGILVPMFIISTIYSFMNPPTLKIGDTPLPSGKAVEVPMHYNKNIELEPIIMEISELKDKYTLKDFNEEDSLRLMYLIDRYNKLK